MSRSKTHAVTVASCIAISLAAILPASCRKKSPDAKQKTAQKSEDDFLDKDAKPEERKYLLAAKPFFIAVAGRKYADAYTLLSSHARARMSFNQFTPAEEEATFQQIQSNPYSNVTAEDVRSAEAQLGSARVKLQALTSPRPEDLAAARVAVDQAQTKLAQLHIAGEGVPRDYEAAAALLRQAADAAAPDSFVIDERSIADEDLLRIEHSLVRQQAQGRVLDKIGLDSWGSGRN